MFEDVFRGSAAVQRLFQDTSVRAGVRVDHVVRCRGATCALPAGALVTGRSAATVRGVRPAWPGDDVEILAPPGMRWGAAQRARRAALAGHAR